MRRHQVAAIALAVLPCLVTPGIALGAESIIQAPPGTIAVIPADGREPQLIPRVEHDAIDYVPLGGFARAIGARFGWDPYSYRGWIETDSLRTRFMLDSPILSHGSEVLQLGAPLAYDENGLLLPTDYLRLLTERWHGDRIAAWRSGAGLFHWGVEAPVFRDLRIHTIGRRTTLRVPSPRLPESSLLWSSSEGLEVVLSGVAAHPESLTIPEPHGLIHVREVRGAPKGCRILLDVDRQALGVDTSYDEKNGVWELTLTSSPDDVAKGGFLLVRPVARPQHAAGTGPVIITAWVDPGRDTPESHGALVDLAQRIVSTLADTLMQPAELLESQGRVEDAISANRARAALFIALRTEGYPGGEGKLQIVRASSRTHWVPLDGPERTQETTARPLLWSETAEMTLLEADRIATILASHLEVYRGPRSVTRDARPLRWLEGLTMPALIIYPAQMGDRISVEKLFDPLERAGLARAIAFGISEALAAGRSERLP